MSETQGTKGVKYADKYAPVKLLEVPVGTKQGDTVNPVGFDGKVYGAHRVAHVLEPGENAVMTFAVAWKEAKPAAARTRSTSAAAEAQAQQAAMNAATLQALAKILERLDGKK